MQSIEGLKDLYSLNWLERQAATLPTGKARQKAMLAHAVKIRGRLAVSSLTYHDRMVRQRKPSVVRGQGGTSCGACHLRLPTGIEHELHMEGRFVLCPHCGVF